MGLLLLGAAPLLAAAVPARNLVETVRRGAGDEALALIRSGAAVRTPDSRGFTPLMWAAALGDAAVIEALLGASPGIDLAAPDGTTALSLAIANGHTRAAALLLGAGVRFDPGAVRFARDAAMAQLLERAVLQGNQLVAAIESRRADLVSALLQSGAPPGYVAPRFARERYGALHVAALSGELPPIRALLAAGVRVSDDGRSEIETALLNHHIEAARLLIGSNPAEPVLRRALETAQAVKKEWLEGGPAIDAAFAPVVARVRSLDRSVSKRDDPPTAPASDLAAILARLRAAETRAPASELRDRALKDTDWLLKRAGDATVSEDYRQSLVRLADLAEASASAGTGLEEIAAELEAKVDHCRKTGVGMGGAIRLRVNTRRGDASVSRWQVLYLLKIYEHAVGVEPGLFPAWSSPTEGSLEPGRYLVWARDPVTKRAGERVLVRLSGDQEIQLDLPVP